MSIVFLGDVHLGRSFPGTPLHRRGDREAMQWAGLDASLATPCLMHVQVGDLFDKAVVPYAVILRAATAYRAAATAAPDTTFVIETGNHDVFKEAGRPSALDVFIELLADLENVVVVRETPQAFGDMVVIPYQPFASAAEYVEQHADVIRDRALVIGHWDMVAIAGKDHNTIPAQQLADLGVGKAVVGHDHVPGTLEIDGLTVIKTGSMQPYSHGEDPEGELYVTVTPAELAERVDELKDKCVRVRVAQGEETPQPIDCLQWSILRVKPGEDEGDEEVVDLGDFNFNQILADAFVECGVPEDIRAQIMARYEEAPNA
jgi:DNA repair exonuclease SbcCD nuclease subunit